MDDKNLRKADLLTSIVLFFLGLFITLAGLQMPMKDSYGGVQNVWYISPALFPLFIGIMLMLLSVVLFRFALKKVGSDYLKSVFDKLIGFKYSGDIYADRNYRFIIILSLFVFYVYMFIPRVDYFISTSFFLMVFISLFYLPDSILQQKLFKLYFSFSLMILFYFLLGIDKKFCEFFIYSNDLIVLVFFIYFCFRTWAHTGDDKELKRRYCISLLVSIFVPLVVAPIFKYRLYVILPKEGLIIEIMNIIRYSFD